LNQFFEIEDSIAYTSLLKHEIKKIAEDKQF